jgi:hypothetical protein
LLHPGSRTRAVVLVIALAVGAGAALGMLTVGGGLLVAIVSGRSFTARDLAGLAVLSLAWGAVFGLALGPLTAFGLLRAVPLGRAVLGTAVGALLGVAATFVLGANPFVAIPAGFLAGAVFLRARYARIARARLSASERADAKRRTRPPP